MIVKEFKIKPNLSDDDINELFQLEEGLDVNYLHKDPGIGFKLYKINTLDDYHEPIVRLVEKGSFDNELNQGHTKDWFLHFYTEVPMSGGKRKSKKKYVINPYTDRKILVGGSVYNKLYKKHGGNFIDSLRHIIPKAWGYVPIVGKYVEPVADFALNYGRNEDDNPRPLSKRF